MRFILNLCFLLSTLACSGAAKAELSNIVARTAMFEQVQQLARNGKFDQLDELATDLWRSRARYEDGTWKLDNFYHGFASGLCSAMRDDASAAATEKALLTYAQQRTKSVNAWMFYAHALECTAWRLRGTGFILTTTPEGRAAFKRYIDKAREALDSNTARLSVNPEWYSHRITLGVYGDEDEAAIDALFREGIAKEPWYYGIYFSALFARTPKWGGSIEEMVAFINKSINYATPDEGVSMYARMAWSAEGMGYWEVADSPDLDWSMMKRSFADVLKAHPADWNAQKFLLMACSHQDAAAMKPILPFIKEPASPALLGKNLPLYESCKSLAEGHGEPLLIHDHKTGKEKLVR